MNKSPKIVDGTWQWTLCSDEIISSQVTLKRKGQSQLTNLRRLLTIAIFYFMFLLQFNQSVVSGAPNWSRQVKRLQYSLHALVEKYTVQ